MNVALLVHNLGEEVNRAGVQREHQAWPLRSAKSTLEINGMKDIRLVAVFSYFEMENV